jgi:hypothetical protein
MIRIRAKISQIRNTAIEYILYHIQPYILFLNWYSAKSAFGTPLVRWTELLKIFYQSNVCIEGICCKLTGTVLIYCILDVGRIFETLTVAGICWLYPNIKLYAFSLYISVQKGIRNSILESYPDIEPYIDNFLPKKDQFKVVKCHEHIELLVNSAGDLIFFRFGFLIQ